MSYLAAWVNLSLELVLNRLWRPEENPFSTQAIDDTCRPTLNMLTLSCI